MSFNNQLACAMNSTKIPFYLTERKQAKTSYHKFSIRRSLNNQNKADAYILLLPYLRKSPYEFGSSRELNRGALLDAGGRSVNSYKSSMHTSRNSCLIIVRAFTS